MTHKPCEDTSLEGGILLGVSRGRNRCRPSLYLQADKNIENRCGGRTSTLLSCAFREQEDD